MIFFLDALRFLIDPANWGMLAGRLGEHLLYACLALAAACVIALPVGLWLGHRPRGASVLLAVSGALRAMPALGLLTFLTVELTVGVSLPLVPTTVVLVILAVPAVLANAFSGMAAVPAEVVDAARAVGHTEGQIVREVELPLAAPTIVGGVRSAMVQVMATTTVAAYIGLGGLGRLILDGLAVQSYPTMVAGALVIIAATLVIDLALAGVQRAVRPRTAAEEGAPQ